MDPPLMVGSDCGPMSQWIGRVRVRLEQRGRQGSVESRRFPGGFGRSFPAHRYLPHAVTTSRAEDLLEQSLNSDRIHSAYLLIGGAAAVRDAATRFARGVVCELRAGERPCDHCSACRRSTPAPPEDLPALDGSGKNGALLRHIGDHPGLLWVERGADDTRVRIGQVRELQRALRLRADPGAWRAAVIADAEWLNQEAQNALLRLLEEPPARCTIILGTATGAGLLATVRSRCQRVVFPAPRVHLDRSDLPEDIRAWVDWLGRIQSLSVSELLEFAEDFRGARAPAAGAAARWLETASLWLRDRMAETIDERDPRGELIAFREMQACRKALAQRNANPQMVVERSLLALQDALRT